MLGHGWKFFVSFPGGTGPEEVANVKSLTPPGDTYPDVDISHLQSAARTFMAGLLEYGEGGAVISFDAESYADLKALGGVTNDMVIESPVGDRLDINGYFKENTIEGLELDTEVTVAITIKCNDVQFTAA